MGLIVERAALEDAEAIVRVQVAAFHDDARLYPGVDESGPPDYDSVEVMRQKIADDITYRFVYDGQIVGSAVLFDEGDGHLHLDVLTIDPAWQNRGFGTLAMQAIERAHPAAMRWTLDTPAYAHRNHHFYEKLGFQKAGEHDVDGFLLFAYEKRR